MGAVDLEAIARAEFRSKIAYIAGLNLEQGEKRGITNLRWLLWERYVGGDRKPGSPDNSEYIIWIGKMIHLANKETTTVVRPDGWTILDHNEFDIWLAKKVADHVADEGVS